MRITNIVRNILRDSPETRNSDKELIIQTWGQLGFYLSERQLAKFRQLPSTETIRRIRQKIQEKGEYQATTPVSKSRQLKSHIVQQNEPQAKPERLELLLEDQPKAISWLDD